MAIEGRGARPRASDTRQQRLWKRAITRIEHCSADTSIYLLPRPVGRSCFVCSKLSKRRRRQIKLILNEQFYLHDSIQATISFTIILLLLLVVLLRHTSSSKEDSQAIWHSMRVRKRVFTSPLMCLLSRWYYSVIIVEHAARNQSLDTVGTQQSLLGTTLSTCSMYSRPFR